MPNDIQTKRTPVISARFNKPLQEKSEESISELVISHPDVISECSNSSEFELGNFNDQAQVDSEVLKRCLEGYEKVKTINLSHTSIKWQAKKGDKIVTLKQYPKSKGHELFLNQTLYVNEGQIMQQLNYDF